MNVDLMGVGEPVGNVLMDTIVITNTITNNARKFQNPAPIIALIYMVNPWNAGLTIAATSVEAVVMVKNVFTDTAWIVMNLSVVENAVVAPRIFIVINNLGKILSMDCAYLRMLKHTLESTVTMNSNAGVKGFAELVVKTSFVMK